MNVSRIASMTAIAPQRTLAELLREWRCQRRLSQEELADRAGLSQRHLSFLETGRSLPSRQMIVRLLAALDLPLRDRNDVLLTAGYAPMYAERSLEDPELASVREALKLILNGHEPYPAFVIDRNYNVVDANRTVGVLLEGVAADMLQPHMNVIRICLHPDGLAPRLMNFDTVHANVVARLQRDVFATGNKAARELLNEIRQYAPATATPELGAQPFEIATSLRLRTTYGELAFHTTLATFTTAFDITVAEFAVESFFPADESTALALQTAGRRQLEAHRHA